MSIRSASQPRARQPHARRIVAPRITQDRPRLIAAGLSSLLPGLGQLLNGRRDLARRFMIPSVALIAIAWLLAQVVPAPRLLATLVNPIVITLVLGLNGVAFAWRVAAVVQAFFDRRFTLAPGRHGLVGLAILVALVALPHGVVTAYGMNARDVFGRVFSASSGERASPAARERTNVLLIGVDAAPHRTTALTDTLMVVSLDPVGRTVSILSIPRDLVKVPLGNGDVYGPKLNSLMTYADRHPKAFPQGGVRALQQAVGALLAIDIHYYATLDLTGFVQMIDAVGGVDVTVTKGFDDPTYDGYGLPQQGWSITAGRHRLDGVNALAFVRARKAAGESDFTRAARQQQVLVALRERVTRGGTLVTAVPDLLAAVGDMIATDFPVERLPEVAALVDDVPASSIVRVVMRKPLIRGGTNRYGSVQVPNVEAIQSMAAGLFSEPGTPPVPWPTPTPSAPASTAP